MYEELNDDFVANRERFTKTLSLQPADRADLLAARARSRRRSSQRRREVVPTDWEGLHPPPWWREIGATLAVRWHRRKMPTATVGTKRRRQLVPVDSAISGSPEEPAALDATGLMTNDLRCCDDSKTMLEGSRGGSASLPTHSTSPFQSPRGRMSVASSHVPHPRPCGPRSCWDRCTILGSLSVDCIRSTFTRQGRQPTKLRFLANSTDRLPEQLRRRARGAARSTDRGPRQVLEPLHRPRTQALGADGVDVELWCIDVDG